jgi:putative membrane protein
MHSTHFDHRQPLIEASIQQLVEMLTAMERVGNTPIPISYSIHLKQCVSLYLFTLPFTLVNDLK